MTSKNVCTTSGNSELLVSELEHLTQSAVTSVELAFLCRTEFSGIFVDYFRLEPSLISQNFQHTIHQGIVLIVIC